MAITLARKQREERAAVLQELREDWIQMRKAVQSNRPEAVLWRLQRVQQAKGMHQLTLPEMLVASDVIR